MAKLTKLPLVCGDREMLLICHLADRLIRSRVLPTDLQHDTVTFCGKTIDVRFQFLTKNPDVASVEED